MIAEWTGVPLNRLSQNEMSVITDLPKLLGDTIKGQDRRLPACISIY